MCFRCEFRCVKRYLELSLVRISMFDAQCLILRSNGHRFGRLTMQAGARERVQFLKFANGAIGSAIFFLSFEYVSRCGKLNGPSRTLNCTDMRNQPARVDICFIPYLLLQYFHFCHIAECQPKVTFMPTCQQTLLKNNVGMEDRW